MLLVEDFESPPLYQVSLFQFPARPERIYTILSILAMIQFLFIRFTRSEELREQIALGPDNAVNWLAGCRSDRADGE